MRRGSSFSKNGAGFTNSRLLFHSQSKSMLDNKDFIQKERQRDPEPSTDLGGMIVLQAQAIELLWDRIHQEGEEEEGGEEEEEAGEEEKEEDSYYLDSGEEGAPILA